MAPPALLSTFGSLTDQQAYNLEVNDWYGPGVLRLAWLQLCWRAAHRVRRSTDWTCARPAPAPHKRTLGRSTTSLSVTVVGASGDLAKKKIFPALFALYYEGLLPKVGETINRLTNPTPNCTFAPEPPPLHSRPSAHSCADVRNRSNRSTSI